MNIWSMDKDESIKCLLLLLRQSVGLERLYLVDNECLHSQSIRIGERSGPATAYIYTYGQTESRYGLHLEYPYLEEGNVSEQEEIYDNIDYESLLEKLIVHFQWHEQTTNRGEA